MDNIANACDMCGHVPARYRFAKESPDGAISEIHLCDEHSGLDDKTRARMAAVREVMMAYLEEIDAMDAPLSQEQQEELNRRTQLAMARRDPR